jgi:hypothetical protein
MDKGILVAVDSHLEWLLPWWWKYYSKYNNYPVAFVDLGLSEEKRKWCRGKGTLIPLVSPDFFIARETIAPPNARRWQKKYKGDLWQARRAWFKKPFACLQSSFDLTLWLDVDCEVCKPLEGLFEQWEPGIELVALPEKKKKIEYNSGVMLFPKSAPFLQLWADLCQKENKDYMGDQNALTELILDKKLSFKELSPIYNWLMVHGFSPAIVIAHWAGGGKEHIRKFGGLHDIAENQGCPLI